ncbi:serine hydrolase domain-containing protein [Xanthomonas sacchari]|uniref:serine hydrolase domain-containing protein n=1 Tax=Xanthomonas sacchari TaxID=56458 RepID=UPI000581BE44|nr:serine hydrolase domain-containing protein [Xanthomonas sacchari]AJC45348.1 penicillin-binding protein [Xanthomonas sacchari]
MKTWLVIVGLLLAASGSGRASDLKDALDAQLKANALGHGIPAQAVRVRHNGELVYEGTTGTTALGGGQPITPRTPFPIYSVSKLFTNTLVLQLVEEGRIDLAAPASRYVPDLPETWRSLRVEQFMNHVTGLPDFFDPQHLDRPFPPTLEAALAAASKRPPTSAPDVQTRYAGTNYLVLAAVLQRVTHTPYRTLVEERIIRPLGLRGTVLEPARPPAGMVASYHADNGRAVVDAPIAWPDYAIAQGCIVSTLEDVDTFLSAIADGKLVSRAALLKHWHPYLFPNGAQGGFASGWEYGEQGRWHELGHDGGSKVRVRILYGENLDDHYVIVYLTNGNRDDVWSRTLVDSVQAIAVPR